MSRRRRLGQNFLVDRDVAQRIVECLAEDPPRVLEIGPGRGALTSLLAERFERVVGLEMDPGLARQLQAKLGDGVVQVVEGDALSVSPEDLTGGEAPWQVAANLPFSVGTAILRRLLPRHDLFTRLVVMLQREVAERVVALPGASAHGLLALERVAHAEAFVAFNVPPGAFKPRPRVTSSVVVLDLRAPAEEALLLEPALALASHALLHRRKTLANALKGRVSAEEIAAAGLDPGARPGTIALDGWVSLGRSRQPR